MDCLANHIEYSVAQSIPSDPRNWRETGGKDQVEVSRGQSIKRRSAPIFQICNIINNGFW